jgi:hypothetical protein
MIERISFNGAKYSDIDGGGELREQIAEIDDEIEQLAERTERCRKLDLISKGAIIAGGLDLLRPRRCDQIRPCSHDRGDCGCYRAASSFLARVHWSKLPMLWTPRRRAELS